jgi:hypothetical protein
VSEFIGRETIDPFGKIVGGYIDACNVMLFFIDRHARRSVASPGAS